MAPGCQLLPQRARTDQEPGECQEKGTVFSGALHTVSIIILTRGMHVINMYIYIYSIASYIHCHFSRWSLLLCII